MADEAVPAKRPNKTLALVLLVFQVLGAGLLTVSAFIAFFQADRETGMWHLSIGALWFVFLGWAARAAMRPFPAQ